MKTTYGVWFMTKKCTNCGSQFIYQHPNQRTCGPDCAKARELQGAKRGGRPKKGEKIILPSKNYTSAFYDFI